jgi:hypothetical protein
MKPRRDAMSKAIFVLLYILASVSSTLAASWPTGKRLNVRIRG